MTKLDELIAKVPPMPWRKIKGVPNTDYDIGAVFTQDGTVRILTPHGYFGQRDPIADLVLHTLKVLPRMREALEEMTGAMQAMWEELPDAMQAMWEELPDDATEEQEMRFNGLNAAQHVLTEANNPEVNQ